MNDTITLRNKTTGENITLQRKEPITQQIQSSQTDEMTPELGIPPEEWMKHPTQYGLVKAAQSLFKPLLTSEQILSSPIGRGAASGVGQIASTPNPFLSSLLPPQIQQRSGAEEISGMTSTAGIAGLMSLGLIPEVRKGIGRHLPIPKMTTEYINRKAQMGQSVVKLWNNLKNDIYGKIYSSIADSPFDSSAFQEAATASKLPVNEIQELWSEIGNQFGIDDVSQINTIGMAKNVHDYLNIRIPQWIRDKQLSGKGGLQNPTIVKNTIDKILKNSILKSVDVVDEQLGKQLRNLDKYASDNIYPYLNKLEKFIGKEGVPKTNWLGYLTSSPRVAQQRGILEATPEKISGMAKYAPSEMADDIANLAIKAKQFLKDAHKIVGREQIKRNLGGVLRSGERFGGLYLILRMLGIGK